MPKVVRRTKFRIYGTEHERNEVKNLRWSELTRKEILMVAAKRLTALAALLGSIIISLPDGPVDSWGDGRSPKTEDQIRDEANAKARRHYDSLNLSDQYTMMYAQPAAIRVPEQNSGNGFLGWIGGLTAYDCQCRTRLFCGYRI